MFYTISKRKGLYLVFAYEKKIMPQGSRWELLWGAWCMLHGLVRLSLNISVGSFLCYNARMLWYTGFMLDLHY